VKKLILAVLLGGMACAMITGCGVVPSSGAENSDALAVWPEMTTAPFDVEIREKMFIAQINDIYMNTDEYIGKEIMLEGMFMPSYYEPTDSMYYMVARYGPGCCGYDGIAGFEVAFDHLGIGTPESNDWVEAVGTLERYEELGQTFLHLVLSSLRVLDTRGAETVLQ